MKTNMFLLFSFLWWVVTATNIETAEKLGEVLSDDYSQEEALKNAQVVCANSVKSKNLLVGVRYILLGSITLCACLQYFFSRYTSGGAAAEHPVTLSVVENVSCIHLHPDTVDLKVVVQISVEIRPEKQTDETEGKEPCDDETTTTPIGECIEPEIILEDPIEGERPQDKINERKPMVFVGGVSASTTPIELVSEFRKQGFNITVLPRIRYGVSFGFCPDLVLSSIEEVEELLACERIWVKDRWVDIRPYIPKDCPSAPVVAHNFNEEKAEKENVEYINVEDLLNSTPSLHATCTPPLGSPINFGQPYIFPLGSPIYVPQQFYQQSHELPYLNGNSMQTRMDTFQHHPISQANSMQAYSSQ